MMSIAMRRIRLAGLMAVGVLALSTTSAAAAGGGLQFLSSIDGKDNPSFPVGFSEPDGVTVDQSDHDVYVNDTENNIVDVLSAAGAYKSQIDGRGRGVAVNDATGEVLVDEERQVAIDVFTSAGVMLAEWRGSVTPSGSFGENEVHAAVDNSTLPSHGDVYVADNEHDVVDLLSASGASVNFTGAASYIQGSELTGTPEGPFVNPGRVAVDDANGDLYVEDNSQVVDVFSPAGEYLRHVKSVSSGQITGVAVDGSTGELYVTTTDGEQGALDVFDSTGTLQYQAGGTPGGSFVLTGGVAVDEETHDVYVDNLGAKVVDVFQPGALPPVPNTDTAGAVMSTSAILHGDLNPEGVSTGYYFTYGKGSSCFGSKTAPGSAGSGTSDVHEEATVSGLEPATLYSFCFYSTSGQTARPGAALTFETAAIVPAVNDRTLSATSVAPTEEVLAGAVNPNNTDTTYYFEYGLTEAYGSTSSPPPGTGIGAGFGDQPVSDTLTGLAPSTTYHYRLVAINAAGESLSSPDETFTTLALPASPTTGGVTEVAYDTATVSGAVVPGSVGMASDTKWCFEYGTVEGEGYNLGSLPLMAGDAGQGLAAVPVSARLTGLAPGTSYRYRLVAVNSLGLLAPGSSVCGAQRGQEADGAEATFTTPITPVPPVVLTGAVSAISQNTATVNGTVNPDGTATSYAFQVGIDTSYGVQIFAESGSGTEAQPVSLDLQDLEPGTTYHYRLVASSRAGTAYGADATFTTPVFPSAALTAPIPEPLVAVPDIAFPAVPVAGSPQVGGSKSKKPVKRKPVKSKKQRKRSSKAGKSTGRGRRAARKSGKASSAGRRHAGNERSH